MKSKKKILRGITCILLTAITLTGIFTSASAAGTLRLATSEAGIDGDTTEFKRNGNNINIFNNDYFDDESRDTLNNHWSVESTTDLLNYGVLYPVKSNGEYTMLLDEDINGQDALALSLFYFWQKTTNGYVAALGSSGTGLSARANTYANAGSIFQSKTYSNGLGTSIFNSSTVDRQMSAYLIANCIERKSGGLIKMSDYSNTKIGYARDNKTLIKHASLATREGFTFLCINDLLVYDGYYLNSNQYYIQAVNLLIDQGQMEGRGPYDDSYGSHVLLALDEPTTYAEFYTMLARADRTYTYDDVIQYSEIDASLTASGDSVDISYKDLLNGASVYTAGTLNASATSSRMSISSYDFSVSDNYGNSNEISTTRAIAGFDFEYDNSMMGYSKTTTNKGDKSYTFPFNGYVTVTDSLGNTDTASASGRNTINVVNFAPIALFTATTDRLNSTYNKLFYYATEPITLTDQCSDYENALTTWTYTIKRNGVTVASSVNFDNIVNNNSIVSAFSGDATAKTHNITFAQSGTYTITATCQDELGKTGTYTATLNVREAPQAPTAIIKANDNTFANYNTVFTDASTDPNDDIVQWTWGKTIMYFDEVMDENGDGTGEGEWVVAEAGKDYTGTLNDSVRNSNGSYTTAAGTLQFKNYGTYRIYLTVTDATGLTDTTYHDINVLEDIPIIIVNPDEPDQPDNYYTVTFINSNDVISSTQVKAGTKTPADKVPAIVDIDGYAEHGWTLDGNKLVEPTSIVVNGNLTFCVLMTPEDENPDLLTVTFINTDGTRSSVKVPRSSTVPQSEVPAIVDDPDLQEYGWTRDGENVVDPAAVTIIQDTLFWVKTDESSDDPGNPDDYEPYYVDNTLYVKQNRSAVIDVSTSLNPPSSPIQADKTEWAVTAVDSYDLSNIKWEQTDPSGKLTNTFIAKEPGTFQVTITLHNDYSDKLAAEKPNSNKLSARTATITVVVYPDADPEADLFVNNANPNFHNNPTSVNVTVASTVLSPDYDLIGTYEWTIYRDTDNDGSYDDEEPIFQKTAENLPSVTFPVEFESGVVGKFKAYLTVHEKFGQTTLSQYITDEDIRYTSTEKEFEVNWTPCISYDFKLNNNEWAYVDDTIPISAILKDENTSTCSTEWRLRKQTSTGFEYVDTSKFDVWSFGTLGGQLRIPDDGYYSLEAKVTDDHGYSETFVSNTIRIYNLPTAVISDDENYRWNYTQWQYKQSRRFDLNGTASYPDDKTGTALHQIDHSKDTWSITPLTGDGTVDDIYVLADNGKDRLESEQSTIFCATQNEFDEEMAIIKPGTYRVDYQVTNTYGKQSAVTSQVITIVEDTAPDITTGTPSSYELLGSEADNRYVTIGMTNVNVASNDRDIVGTEDNFEAYYRYDSDNDGDYEDETWNTCKTEFSDPGNNTSKLKLSVTADVNQVGMYQIKLVVKESFGQETLDSIIPPECYISKEFFHEVQVDNTRPQGTFDVANNVYGDVVFAMGSSSDVSEVSEKTLNYANSFGDVEGADVFQLDVQTVETITDGISSSDLDVDDIINNWDVHGSDIWQVSNGEIYCNANNSWHGTALLNPDGDYEQIYYKISMVSPGLLLDGICFNVTVNDDGSLNGYFINFYGHGSVKCNLFRFDNYKIDTAFDVGINRLMWCWGSGGFYSSYTTGTTLSAAGYGSFTDLQQWNPKTACTYEIYCKDGRIQVLQDGTTVADVQDSTYTHGTYGLWGNNCEATSSMHLKDLYIEAGKTVTKTLTESLSDVSFNNNHDVFVVWTEDTIPKELDSTSPTYEEDYATLLTMLNSQNVHLIVLGSDQNKAVMQSLLNQCIVPGIFINTGTVDGDLDASRDFIASVLRQASDADVKYVLVDEQTEYNKYYTDYNGHPHWLAEGDKDSILSSKWWYSQDENYFLNPLGTISENEEWLSDEITTFTKTGKYYVDYKVKDNSVPDAWLSNNSTENPFDMYRYWSNNYGNDEYDESGVLANPYAEIYVHRRPIADFNFIAHLTSTDELTGIDITNSAYDLDHYEAGNAASRADKGLQMYEWTWQLANNSAQKHTAVFLNADEGEQWINEQLANVSYNSDTGVLVSYRVRDIDGVETKENVSNTHEISGNIYLAPASYHHTTLDKDLVVNGVTVAKAGIYVTTSYTEAISELRAAADAKKAVYDQRAAQYNTLEAAAVAAEQARDAKQQEVTNKENELTSLKSQLATAQTTLSQYQSNLSAANTTKASAKSAYETAQDELVDLQSELSTLNSELTSLKSQLSSLQNELSSLQSELTALENTDTTDMTEDELTAHQNAIVAKQTAVSEKQSEVNTKQAAVTAKQSEVAAKQKAVADKTTEVNNLYSAYQTAITTENNWQTKVSEQQTKVNNLSSDVSTATSELTGLRSELTALTSQADIARLSANTAKASMDTAKVEWDAAEAAVAAVKPISTNVTAWATTTALMTIPDGVWSNYNTVRISGNPIAPVAKFVPNKIYFDLKENVSITDQSYSPNGNNIVKWVWTITNDYHKLEQTQSYSLSGASGTTKVGSVAQMQALIGTYITNLINSQELGLTNADNTYKITLTVTDDKSVPLTSDPYSVSIVLVPSNNSPTTTPTDKSIYSKDGVLVYEYDPYDANVKNSYYTYGGASQLRGTETIDWTLLLDDPDNHDSYGTANDSDNFIINYLMELFKDRSISNVTSDRTTTEKLTYGDYNVTTAGALVNSNLAPFTSAKDGNLSWGAYRITTTISDVPNNGSEGKSVQIITSNNKIPKHLYVVPALDIGNVQYTWSETGDEADPQDLIPVGDTITVTCTTNAETVGVQVKMPTGSGSNSTINATLVSTDSDGTKHWSATVTIPNDLEEDDLTSGKEYGFSVEAWTDYGRDTGEKTRTKSVTKTINVLPLKLYDFNITNIADPSVGFDGNAVYVPDLAYDKSSSPNNVLTKKGYAFYFEISSKGMRGDDDSISITPSFYGYESGLYGQQLDVYYKLSDGSYVPASYAGNGAFSITTADGDTLGTAGQITLDADNRTSNGLTQKWAGMYGLPSTAIFVKHGGDPDNLNDRWTDPLNKGVLIAFDIDAVKNGENKYDYISRGQWNEERTTSSGAYVNSKKAIYQDGAVIVIDSKHSAAGDYESRPVWRRS